MANDQNRKQWAKDRNREAPRGEIEPPRLRAPLPTVLTPASYELPMLQLWAGFHKVGKTVQAASMPGGTLFAATEPGQGHVDGFIYPCRSWSDLKDCADLLEEERVAGRQLPYANVCIDTAANAFLFCQRYMRKKLGVTHESDADWGKGHALLDEEFRGEVMRFAQLGLRTVFTCHIEVEERTFRGQHKTTFKVQLSKGARQLLVSLCDMVLVFATKDDPNSERQERVIICDKVSFCEEAGIRMPPDFIALKREFPFELPMNYRALVATWDALKPNEEEAAWLLERRKRQAEADAERMQAEAKAFAERVAAKQTRVTAGYVAPPPAQVAQPPAVAPQAAAPKVDDAPQAPRGSGQRQPVAPQAPRVSAQPSAPKTLTHEPPADRHSEPQAQPTKTAEQRPARAEPRPAAPPPPDPRMREGDQSESLQPVGITAKMNAHQAEADAAYRAKSKRATDKRAVSVLEEARQVQREVDEAAIQRAHEEYQGEPPFSDDQTYADQPSPDEAIAAWQAEEQARIQEGRLIGDIERIEAEEAEQASMQRQADADRQDEAARAQVNRMADQLAQKAAAEAEAKRRAEKEQAEAQMRADRARQAEAEAARSRAGQAQQPPPLGPNRAPQMTNIQPPQNRQPPLVQERGPEPGQTTLQRTGQIIHVELKSGSACGQLPAFEGHGAWPKNQKPLPYERALERPGIINCGPCAQWLRNNTPQRSGA